VISDQKLPVKKWTSQRLPTSSFYLLASEFRSTRPSSFFLYLLTSIAAAFHATLK